MARDPAGAPAWRAWNARVQRVRPAGGTGYVAYVVVLLVAMYGSMAWSFLASLELGGPGAGGLLERYAVLVFALFGVAAVAAARVGGPLWVSRRTAVYALSGQFRPRDVLRRRAVGILLAASLLGGFLAFAVVSGRGSVAASALGALGAASAVAALVALGVIGQVRRWRVVADVVVGAVVLLGLALVRWGGGGRAGVGAVAVAVAVVVGVVGWWVVLRLVPPRLDVDDVAERGARTARAGRGMVAGDTRAVGQGLPVRHRGSRRLFGPTTTAVTGRVPAPWTALARRAPILARDLVGQRRRPVSTVGGAVTALVGSWLVVVPGSGGALVAGALLLYGAAGALGLGLRAFLAQSVPGGLLPGRPRTVLAWHAALPGLALVASLGLAAGGAVGMGASGKPDLVTGAGMAVAALAVRAWAAGGSVVPAVLSTPVVSPVGDLSVLNFAAYFVRGWLVVAGVGGLAGAAHEGQGWVVPLVAAGIFAALAARAAER